MTSTVAPVAEPMQEDQWVVRGTLDPVTALGAVVADSDDLPDGDDRPAEWWAAWCHGMVARARPGWWRKIPVRPFHELAGDGCTWQLRPVDQRGPGVFEGVFFPT